MFVPIFHLRPKRVVLIKTHVAPTELKIKNEIAILMTYRRYAAITFCRSYCFSIEISLLRSS
jgi:hypothetical protein